MCAKNSFDLMSTAECLAFDNCCNFCDGYLTLYSCEGCINLNSNIFVADCLSTLAVVKALISHYFTRLQ